MSPLVMVCPFVEQVSSAPERTTRVRTVSTAQGEVVP
jgi:hypothetical protein